MVTMVWVVSRFRLKAPPGISSSHISPLTSSGQRSRASWASEPQKSATLSPQPGGKPRKVHKNMWWHWWKKAIKNVYWSSCKVPEPGSLVSIQRRRYCLLQVMAALSVSLGSMVVGFASAYTSPALVSMAEPNSTVQPDLQQVSTPLCH